MRASPADSVLHALLARNAFTRDWMPCLPGPIVYSRFPSLFCIFSPKFTRRKFEISTTEAGNPIKQDEKNGKPRVFSKGDIFFNYGCFPRTWEVRL